MPPKIIKKSYKPKKGARNYKKKSQYRQQKLSVATIKKIAKQAVMRTAETKQVDTASSENQLYHNFWTGSAFENLTNSAQLPAQGTGENQRLGNEIYVSGVKLYLQILLKNDRLNTKVRVLIVKHNPNFGKSTYTDWFDSIMNVMVDPADKGRATVVYDKIHGYRNFNPTNSTDEVVIFRQIWLPVKEKYVFRDDGAQSLSYTKNTYSIIAMAYDTAGSLTTDNVASIKWYSRLFYKDM